MSSNRPKTEDKIKQAALRVFTAKGYDATTTRDIAKEADVNIASLHYYFRSKDKLFSEVAGETLSEFNNILHRVMMGDEPLKLKIHQFVEQFTDFYKKHPKLPAFIMSESARNESMLHQIISFRDHSMVLANQLEELIAKGEIRPITILDFMSNLVGLMIFPFMSKHIFENEFQLTKAEFHQLLESRKQSIPNMIISDLYMV
ncbi:MAG: TetR/AcrR family transcriptional regulator [Bacteroidota bacterium]